MSNHLSCHDGLPSRPRLAPMPCQPGFSRYALLCLAGIVGMGMGQWAAAEGNSGLLSGPGIGAWMDQPAETGEPADFRGQAPATKVMRAVELELDRARCNVTLAGQDVTLTATEFRLLEFLMSRPGVVFSREQLLDAVWGHDRAVTDRTVDVYILRLRQKIEVEDGSTFIRSVRGFGYSFTMEPAPVEQAQ